VTMIPKSILSNLSFIQYKARWTNIFNN
jgi:hypothetical protein